MAQGAVHRRVGPKSPTPQETFEQKVSRVEEQMDADRDFMEHLRAGLENTFIAGDKARGSINRAHQETRRLEAEYFALEKRLLDREKLLERRIEAKLQEHDANLEQRLNAGIVAKIRELRDEVERQFAIFPEHLQRAELAVKGIFEKHADELVKPPMEKFQNALQAGLRDKFSDIDAKMPLLNGHVESFNGSIKDNQKQLDEFKAYLSKLEYKDRPEEGQAVMQAFKTPSPSSSSSRARSTSSRSA